MIKKFSTFIKEFSFYILILIAIVLLTFYLLEKSVRSLRLAQFTPMDHNWDQLKLSDEQIIEIFKKNNDEIDKDNIDKLYTGYDFYLSYVTKEDGKIYYRQYKNELSECSEIKKIYLFGGSLVAGDGIPKNKDLLSSQLSSTKEASDNCHIFINRGVSGHNFDQIFNNIINYHENIDGDVMVIFGINSFVNNVYSNKKHLLEDKFKKNFNYIIAENFKEKTKIYIYEFSKKLHSVKLLKQFIDNNYKFISEKDYWYKSKIFLDKKTIKNRSISSCKTISTKAFLLKKFLEKKNKKIIFLQQPIIDDLDNMDEFEKQIKSKAEEYLFYMKNIENGESHYFQSYKEFLNICEKEFKFTNLNFNNLNLAKKDLEKTYYIDYIHMTPSGIKALSDVIINKLMKYKFL